MRVVVQRVTRAEVRVDGRLVGGIGRGLLVFVGVRRGDTESEARWLARKIPALRIFKGSEGAFANDLAEAGGQILVVSQFTLHGDARKGRRPSFDAAEEPGRARALYAFFVEALRADGWDVSQGEFGAKMEVELVNDGPVTLILDRDPPAP
jgi:D-tyrosyl-tRNA(Tyr) deacylase